MKRLIATALALIMFVTTPVMAANWSSVLGRIKESVVRLNCVEHEKAICTAFSINRNGTYLTAYHCLEAGGVTIEGEVAKVLFESEIFDIAVIQGKSKPALQLADSFPRAGSEVLSFGFGYGGEVALARVANVSANTRDISGTDYVLTDSTFVGGMSGGPIVNNDGKVVGIVAQGDEFTGVAVGAGRIKQQVGKYFEDR